MSENLVDDISTAGIAAFLGSDTRFSGSSDDSTQRTGARRRFPTRRLHLVDIENLVGVPLPSLGQVCRARGLYGACLAFGAMDQIEVASSHLTLVNAALGWPHAHYRVRSGPDGADLALLDVLRHEDVAGRFTHVAIGSGDHLFAEEAARLAAQGVWVTVVSRRCRLSRRLELAAREVILLDTQAEAAWCSRMTTYPAPGTAARTDGVRSPRMHRRLSTSQKTRSVNNKDGPVGDAR